MALATVGAWIVEDLRADHVEHSRQEMMNLSFVLATALDRELQGVDLLALSLIEHMRQLGIDSPDAFDQQMKPLEVHQDLARRIAGLPHIAALSLHDRNGALLNFSGSWPAPGWIDFRDRDFIRVLLAPDPPKTVISEPLLSKTTGKWTIYFSRRFEASDGTLIGIVVSSIAGEYFEQFFSKLVLDDDDTFSLYRSDGMLLVHHPHADPKIGTSFAQSDYYNRMLDVLDHDIARMTSNIDGKDRLVAGHSVAHYPLIVTVSDTVDAVLETWRNEARAFAAVIAFLELVIAMTVLLAVRHLRAYELLQAAETAQARAEERERGASTLERQAQRFDMALNNMRQGLLMFDHAGQLLVVNRRFCDMLGIPVGALAPGMSYDELTERVVATGDVTAEDMRGIREHRAELARHKQNATATWELASGRAFITTFQPMADGWLTTFEEITERRRTEARIAHLARHDALTELPNRAVLREALDKALVHARRGHGLALLRLDLDQFKHVNDTLGHPVGDALLQAVADRLLGLAQNTDTLARLGGDEFAVIHAPIDRPTDATAFAERLIALFDAPFVVAGQQISIGTSIGIAFAPHDGLEPDQLLKSADLALYRAKVDGRGVYRLFQADMDAQIQARRRLELDLRRALAVAVRSILPADR
jgi:diguanylate cyclase (GGDEF)-like protein